MAASIFLQAKNTPGFRVNPGVLFLIDSILIRIFFKTNKTRVFLVVYQLVLV